MTRSRRYQLLERIGRGGMAEVFRARMLGPDGFEKLVCIKRILAEQSRSPGFEDMFRDEARIAALLCHASIVQVFDYDRDEADRLFIAMEYVHGVSLRRLVVASAEQGAVLTPDVVATVARGALLGLHHASTHLHDGRPLNVIHRDISPHNILLSTSGEVKIADFGIAKAFVSSVRTRQGVIKGKASYMSPEQATGRKLDVRSDLYSLGVVLWEMLTGRRLFVVDGRVPWAALLATREPAPPVARQAPDVPGVLASLVDSMLSVKPDDRPATPADALAVLEGGDVRFCSTMKLADLVKRAMPADVPDQAHALAPTEPEGAAPVTLAHAPVTAETEDDTPPDPMDSADILTSTRRDGPVDDTRARPAADEGTPPPVSGEARDLTDARARRSARWLVPVAAASAGVVTAAVALVAVAVLIPGLRENPRGITDSGAVTPRAAHEEPSTRETARGAYPGQADPRVAPAAPASHPPPVQAAASTATPADEARTASPKSAGFGVIAVNARPWASVYLDGKHVGDTPLTLKKVKAGKHVIRLVNPDLDLAKKLRVNVPAHETVAVSHDFTQ